MSKLFHLACDREIPASIAVAGRLDVPLRASILVFFAMASIIWVTLDILVRGVARTNRQG